MNVRALALFFCLSVATLTANPQAQEGGIGIRIVSPQNEETIHDNTGWVPVTVAITNGDPLAAGGAIRVLLDGQPFGPEARAPSLALEGVERGEHLLRVQVVDAAGTIIATSDTVRFYMWRASALFPSRKK